MHDIMATIKCKSSNSPFSSEHSCRRHNDLSCTFKQRLALSFLWYAINYLSMTLPSWLHDLSGSAEMPSWPKFALFGLPSGLPIQKQFSTQCESNLWCKKNTSAWNRSRKKPSIRRKILRDRFLKMDRDYWKIINTDTLMIQNIKFTISTFFQSLRL